VSDVDRVLRAEMCCINIYICLWFYIYILLRIKIYKKHTSYFYTKTHTFKHKQHGYKYEKCG